MITRRSDTARTGVLYVRRGQAESEKALELMTELGLELTVIEDPNEEELPTLITDTGFYTLPDTVLREIKRLTTF